MGRSAAADISLGLDHNGEPVERDDSLQRYIESILPYLLKATNKLREDDYDKLNKLAVVTDLNRFKAVLREVVDEKFRALNASTFKCVAIAALPCYAAAFTNGGLAAAIGLGVVALTPAVVPLLVVTAALAVAAIIAFIVKRCSQSAKIKRLRMLRKVAHGSGPGMFRERVEPGERSVSAKSTDLQS